MLRHRLYAKKVCSIKVPIYYLVFIFLLQSLISNQFKNQISVEQYFKDTYKPPTRDFYSSHPQSLSLSIPLVLMHGFSGSHGSSGE